MNILIFLLIYYRIPQYCKAFNIIIVKKMMPLIVFSKKLDNTLKSLPCLKWLLAHKK